MKNLFGLAMCLTLVVSAGLDPVPVGAYRQAAVVRHRSPVDLAVLPDGRHALTANHTSGSASLVDLVEGKVLQEAPCGRKPSAVACSADGRWGAVSNLWSGSVTLFAIRDGALSDAGTLSVGDQPRGLVFAPDGKSLYVALAGDHEVVRVEIRTSKILNRWDAPGEPRRLALSPDGATLAAACGRSGEVRCWETRTGQLLSTRRVYDAFNLHGLTYSPCGKDLVAAYVHHRHSSITKHNIDHGWALNSRLARLPVLPDPNADHTQLALDTRGKAVGDPCAVAFNLKGNRLVAVAGGTAELLCFQAQHLPWSPGDAGDFIDPFIEQDGERFNRLPLGGRPLSVAFMAGTDQAAVANYLRDSVQVVDVGAGRVLREVHLGGPREPSLARKGEAIFFDAKRSHHHWFSCHTCHTDGHTSGRTFDTTNDDSHGNPKLTPTLRGVAQTSPWTWHGWQQDLGEAVEKSLTETMFDRAPTADEVRAVVAFLETLEHPPSPLQRTGAALSDSSQRGRALFEGKARCIRCHQGSTFTSARNYDVKIEDDGSPFELWNPPSLRGVRYRGPFLHDGRADSLDAVLRRSHAPEKLGGEPLTAEERADLIEYLNSL